MSQNPTTTPAAPTRPGRSRAAALLLGLALLTGACASSDDDEAQIEVDSTVAAGQADGAVTDGDDPAASTESTAAGADGEAVGEGGDGTAADDGGAASSGGASTSAGVNAKTAAARTVDDLNEAADPVNGSDEAALVFDQPNEGEIESALGADRWTFDGTDGQLLAVDVLDIGSDCNQDLTLILESPSGKRGEVAWVGNNGCYIQGPLLLDETGPWVLELKGGDGAVITDATGPYRFVPTVLTEVDESPVVFDEPNEGAIDEALGVDLWTFEAVAGDQLSVEMEWIGGRDTCQQDLSLALIDPFEERIELEWVGNGGCSLHGPYDLERDGTYAIELSGGDGAVISDATGPYRFVPHLVGA